MSADHQREEWAVRVTLGDGTTDDSGRFKTHDEAVDQAALLASVCPPSDPPQADDLVGFAIIRRALGPWEES
jgi:hypothetical protein